MKWETYNPECLISLAKVIFPDEQWLHDALSECTRCMREGSYLYFVDRGMVNKLGNNWDFNYNIELKHPYMGHVVLDILNNRNVGGADILQSMNTDLGPQTVRKSGTERRDSVKDKSK